MGLPSCLVVAHGRNAGARLVLDSDVRLVGRARDADLVLDDHSVSRRHFHVVAVDDGAHLRVCHGASQLLHAGQYTRDTVAKAGDSIVVGNTVLLVVGASHEVPSSGVSTTTTVHAVVNGLAADVYGLAAVFALNDTVGGAEDVPSVLTAIADWAKVHANCDSVDLRDEAASPHRKGIISKSHPEPGETLIETIADGGTARIAVPVSGAASGWLVFTTKASPDRVTRSLRGLLLVAGQAYSARVARLVAEEERAAFRKLAIGSARAFLGASPAAQRVVELIPKIAASGLSAIVSGESGVGKTFVARLIHESGSRRNAPFRVIHCATLVENEIEMELFGYERGAFTGARSSRPGAFEAAANGTVFLHEIAGLSLTAQAKLRTILEGEPFTRLGSRRLIELRARIVVSTCRDLKEMVDAGTFRSDLYYRLGSTVLPIPPLRERGDDIVLLAKGILADLSAQAGRSRTGFSREALERLRSYTWPGNVRELRNVIEHAVQVSEHAQIAAYDLPVALQAATEEALRDALVIPMPATLEEIERHVAEAVLQRTGGNRTKAAEVLGITRNTLVGKLRGTTE